MEEANKKPTENAPDKKAESDWIERAEAKIDEAAEKIHKSDTYRKADKKLEDATKKLFRKAGRLWGKL